MANNGSEEATLTQALTLHELPAHRDEIKAEIGSSCRVLKGEITTLRSETRADMTALHEELTGELTKLCAAQAEAKSQLKDVGNALSDTMDSDNTGEKNNTNWLRNANTSRKSVSISKTGAGDEI